jgi:acyl-CoA synthetase (AMP-forming)/AMP-acid ligase II
VHGALLQALRATSQKSPSAPAITFVGSREDPYTFEEIHATADVLAQGLARLGLPARAPVGILARSQEDQVLHFLAALVAGYVPVILTPPNQKLNRAYYLHTMQGLLKTANLHAIVTDLDTLDVPCPTVRTRTLEPIGHSASRVSGDEGPPAAFLQFSSGTTGIKKGVLVTDDAALTQVQTYGSAIRLAESDVIVSWLPLYHDMGFIACFVMPLVWGIHTVMIDPIDWVTRPSSFVQLISDHRGTLAWNPNFAYAFMGQRASASDLRDVDLSSLRGLVNCSEPVTRSSQTLFAERFARHGLTRDVFWGCYAMAETTFALTHGEPTDAGHIDPLGPTNGELSSPQVSVGRALPGVELRVAADDGSPLPDRELGEVLVRSPFTFSGYFNDPEATRRAFVDGWYRTGDLGYAVGDAYYILDRLKDVMIVSGVNVVPRDIEELVSSVEGVIPGRVAAFSVFDQRVETERIVVLFESTEGGRAGDQLVLEVRQRVLAAFQIANFDTHAVPAGWLVKSSAGKIARRANREKWLSGAVSAVAS